MPTVSREDRIERPSSVVALRDTRLLNKVWNSGITNPIAQLFGVTQTTQALRSHARLKYGPAYRALWPTKLDKIKNLSHQVRLGFVILRSPAHVVNWQSPRLVVGGFGLYWPTSTRGLN